MGRPTQVVKGTLRKCTVQAQKGEGGGCQRCVPTAKKNIVWNGKKEKLRGGGQNTGGEKRTQAVGAENYSHVPGKRKLKKKTCP